MGIPDDVDLCVTCVTDKPPQLPLREELMSLGVEVIFNAQGTGARAVKHETRKKVKDFRKEYSAKNRNSVLCFAWKSHKQKLKEKQERKLAEKELKKKMQGLSYDKYTKILNGEDISVYSSESSWNTNSTRSSSDVSEKRGAVRWGATIVFSKLKSPKNEGKHPDYLSDAAIASAFADSNAANLLKGPNDSEEPPATISFKPRNGKTNKYTNESDSVEEEQEEVFGLGAYSFLSGNTSIKKAAGKVSSTDMFTYKWDVAPSGEFNGDSSSDGSLYTSGRADEGTKKSESGSEKKLPLKSENSNMLAITNDDSTKDDELHWNDVDSLLIFAKDTATSKTKEHGTDHDYVNPAYKNFLQGSEDENSFILEDGSASINMQDREDASIRSEVSSVPRKHNEGSTLLATLSRGCTPNTSDLASFVECDSSMFPKPGGSSPLHEACDEEFPDRLSSQDVNILYVVDELILDIVRRTEKINFITKYLPYLCMTENQDGDLPVHLLVRRLVEWEAAWQEHLTFAKVESWTDVTKFTQLHKCMGECVDKVLNPMVRNRLACRSRGKLGTKILPLHAAAMFAVPYGTIQLLLESYPEAASVACDLADLDTYIDDKSLPLQLLERKRSESLSVFSEANASADERDNLFGDFEEENEGIRWTKSALCSPNNADDLIRRSDLIFAFNPDILPFRKDAARLKRIELIIRSEAQVTIALKRKTLESTARAAWTWLCTFEEEEDTYADVVERIVNALDVHAVKFLASLETPHGTILHTAQPECAQVIQARLDRKLTKECREPSSSSHKSRLKQGSQRSILKHGRENKKLSYIVNDTLCKNALCREVFNIREETIPTNVVLLPYELKKNEDGSLGLGSGSSAVVAIQFASCLTELTEPWHVNHLLEKKARDCLGYRLSPERAIDFQSLELRSRNMEQRLLNLFEGKGFLYVLDENTGRPVVPLLSDSNHFSPLTIENPVEAINHLLPLLLMGMIRMRGEKATVILMQTMMAGKRSPPERWITISQNIVRYLCSQRNKMKKDARYKSELLFLSESLSNFVLLTTKRNAKRRCESEDGREWSSEISYLKTILEGTALLSAAKFSSAKVDPHTEALNDETINKKMSIALVKAANVDQVSFTTIADDKDRMYGKENCDEEERTEALASDDDSDNQEVLETDAAAITTTSTSKEFLTPTRPIYDEFHNPFSDDFILEPQKECKGRNVQRNETTNTEASIALVKATNRDSSETTTDDKDDTNEQENDEEENFEDVLTSDDESDNEDVMELDLIKEATISTSKELLKPSHPNSDESHNPFSDDFNEALATDGNSANEDVMEPDVTSITTTSASQELLKPGRQDSDEFHNLFSDESMSAPHRESQPASAKPMKLDNTGDVSTVKNLETTSLNQINTSPRPPLAPKTAHTQDKYDVYSSRANDTKLTSPKFKEYEERLNAIKNRLKTIDRIVLSGDSVRDDVPVDHLPDEQDDQIIFIDEPDLDALLDDQLPPEYYAATSLDDTEWESFDSRDDYSIKLMSRLFGLEERIHDSEEEMELLRLEVCSFEMKAADAI